MRTWANDTILAVAILGIAAGSPLAVRADALPALLCQRDEVLRIVDRTVRSWNLYNRILYGTVIESPTTMANAVVCHATMQSVAYEATLEGWVPRVSEGPRRYDVQVLGNRLFVQVSP